MNDLLIFFALPIAIIIFSIALEMILRNPILVSGIIFSVFLIVTAAIGILELLIATIVYTIISFITAYITMIIMRQRDRNNEQVGQCRCRRQRRVF